MLVTPQQMYAAEKECDINYISLDALMQNAGSALCDFVVDKCGGGDVLVLCGNGNNAGDGFVCAALLKRRGFNVACALVCGRLKTELAYINFESARFFGVEMLSDFELIKQRFAKCNVVIDCVFGTGFKGELSDELISLFATPTKATKISVDIPSGANGLTGVAAKGAFCADYTLTFGRKKVGLAMQCAKSCCGEITVVDIGIPDECFDDLTHYFEIDKEFVRKIIKKRKPNSHKGDFGTLLCVCSNENMVGACAMCVNAALRSGVGLVIAACPKSVRDSLASAIPECVWLGLDVDENGFLTADNEQKILKTAQKATAVVIGCGLGVTNGTKELVKSIITKINCPIILDADGINCISDSIDILMGKDNIVITPHPGEAARLLNCTNADVQNDRLSSVYKLAQFGGVAVLKGAGTIVARGSTFGINTSGNSGMSRAGSGDVLAGIIGALAAQKINLYDACALGVYLHGLCGDFAADKLTQYSCLPRDFIEQIGAVFADIESF